MNEQRTRISHVAMIASALLLALLITAWIQEDPAGETQRPESKPAGARTATPARAPDPIAPAADPTPIPVPEPVSLASLPPITVRLSAFRTLPGGSSTPAGGARLEFGVCPEGRVLGKPVHVVDTDALGEATLEVPWSSVAPGPDGTRRLLWARDGDGLTAARITYADAPEAPGGSVTLEVKVHQVVVVCGRILGPDGEPVAGRASRLQVERSLWSNAGRSGHAGADGLFRVAFRKEGLACILAGGTRHPDTADFIYYRNHQLELGTGVSEPFEVRFGEPTPFVEVRVRGPGEIRGRILDAAGHPATAVSLVAILAELDDGSGGLGLPREQSMDVQREGRGHHMMQAVTDADGAFEFRGLCDGLFTVRSADGGESWSEFPTLVTEQPVPSDGAPLVLRLTRTHLVVHVRRANGNVPVDEAGATVVKPWRRGSNGWPAEPRLLVTSIPDQAHVLRSRYLGLETKETAPGEFVVELDDEQIAKVGAALDVTLGLQVGIVGGAIPWRPVRVDVPVKGGRVDVHLTLPSPSALGVLELEVLDEEGAAVGSSVRVRVHDPGTGVVLVDTSLRRTEEDAAVLRTELPVGEYRLLVEGEATHEFAHGTLVAPREHGAFEAPLHIRAGVDTHLTAVLGAPSRLALHVVGTPTDADTALAYREWDSDSAEAFAPRVQLRLEQPGRPPVYPGFARRGYVGGSAEGLRPFSSMEMGSEETSEPITPGTYTLVGTTPSGRVATQAVTLVPGETLSVTLTFE